MSPTETAHSLPANSDPAELALFQAYASRWWDPGSEFGTLHAINPLRLGWIESVTPLAGLKVVDVGCGGGILSESMAMKGALVKGIDLGEKLLRVAELHGLESGVQVGYERVAVEDLAEREPASFDLVTCMEMLEHVPDPASVVRACARLLRPGGRAVFTTLNRSPKSFLFAIVGAEYVLRLLPRGSHHYEKFIKPSELVAFARGSGLDLLCTTGMTYNPINRQYRLVPDDLSVNYFAAFRKPE